MAKVDHTINASVTGAGVISELLEVMAANYDALPEAVKEAIQQIDEDPTTYDREYLLNRLIPMDGLRVYVDGDFTENVISGSRIGKLVQIDGKVPFMAESFWIVSPDGFVCGWGEKPEIGGEQ